MYIICRILLRSYGYIVFEELAPKMSVSLTTLASLTTEYSRSDKRRPALILSDTHSGRTTWTFDLLVSSFCVFVPLSCCDVRIWVAPEAVCLSRIKINQPLLAVDRSRWTYNTCPPASVTIRFISMSVVLSR